MKISALQPPTLKTSYTMEMLLPREMGRSRMRTHKKETTRMMRIRSRKHRTRTRVVRRTRWRSRMNRRSPTKRTRREQERKKKQKENYKEKLGENCERPRGDEAGGELEDVVDGIRAVPQS